MVHDIRTADQVLYDKATLRPMMTVLDIVDDDTAAIVLGDANILALNEGGAGKRFLSRALLLAGGKRHLDNYLPTNLLVVAPTLLNVEPNSWQSINKPITVAALDGDYDAQTNFDLLITATSQTQSTSMSLPSRPLL